MRFATGDLSAVLPGTSPCGRTNLRIKGWMGRADQTTKVRGMFVHPSQVADVLRRHPEIDRVVLPPIVYVTGTIRSGTTLCHNVMAQHVGAKPLLRWELMEPIPPPDLTISKTTAGTVLPWVSTGSSTPSQAV